MLSATKYASIALMLAMPGAAFAASEQASDQFAQEMEQKCTDAVGDMFRRPMIAVDPDGTQSYGVAIVYGRSREMRGPAAVICVMDKKTGRIEVGSPMGKDIVRVRKPKPDGQDDNQQPRNNRRQQQNNNGQQNQMMDNNDSGSDDMGDDQQ
jgi:hypothetical protein